MEKEILAFLAELTDEVKTVGMDAKNFKIDHIAFSATSTEEYEKQKTIFSGYFSLVREPVIGGRRVAVYKFTKPVSYKGQVISAVELIEPKSGENPLSGWEHAEFLVDDFDSLIKKYPDANWTTKDKERKDYARIKIELPSGREIKFLKVPILDEV